MALNGKNVLLGVTGGIAAYKSASLLRRLLQHGAMVRVMMTQSACRFVQPLTFEVLSGQRVHTKLFWEQHGFSVLHVSLAKWADALVIAPATANMIGKIAQGIADDLVSTAVMAFDGCKVLAPAMESHMLANQIVQGNIGKLQDMGYSIAAPGEGRLASGAMGQGRMAEPRDIAHVLERCLGRPAHEARHAHP